MKYESFSNTDKEQIIKLLKSDNSEEIIATIVGAVNGVNDWEWLQNELIQLVNHSDFWVAKTAINGLGDIVRIHKNIDTQLVIDKLKDNKREDLEGVIGDCIEDISLFLKS